MFVGHIAGGVAIKALFPRTPTLPIMIGVGLMDILDGLFVLIGLDHIRPNLASGPYVYFDLVFVDWDHSLVMALIIALIWAFLFRRDKRTGLIAGFSVISHFLEDWPVHNNDLALYPHADAHLGYGLWGTVGTWAWVLEGLFCAALLGFAWRRLRQQHGISLLWPVVILSVSFFNVSPWLSPTKFVAQLAEPWPQMLYGALTMCSFLGLGFGLTWLINQEERRVGVLPCTVKGLH